MATDNRFIVDASNEDRDGSKKSPDTKDLTDALAEGSKLFGERMTGGTHKKGRFPFVEIDTT